VTLSCEFRTANPNCIGNFDLREELLKSNARSWTLKIMKTPIQNRVER
jgi:hypothetical protein